MEKKNFAKKTSKRVSNKPTDELTKKRYSKCLDLFFDFQF